MGHRSPPRLAQPRPDPGDLFVPGRTELEQLTCGLHSRTAPRPTPRRAPPCRRDRRASPGRSPASPGGRFSGLHAVELAATDDRSRPAWHPGEFGAVANEQAFGGLEIIRPKDGTEWDNRVAARSILGIAAHRPDRKAADIQCPILLVVGVNDTIAPAGPALKVAERAPKSELYRSRGGHYDVYEGGQDYENVVRVEVEFLTRHAGLSAQLVTAPKPV